ncbi:MAG: alpha/beta hydrolase [Epsilonproteobacteria bacterium]|nr:alpha/beta hydrolase [Campylobacterota bacterium]
MKIIVITVILLYGVVSIYFYLTQDSKIFNVLAIEKKASFKLKNSKEIKLKVANHVVLDGIYKKSDKKDAPLLIYFGGNADDATRFLLHIKSLEDFNVVVFNYRGYLKSTGKPSEKNLFNDALKIYDTFAKNQKVIIIGRSLGSGVAIYLASKRKALGVVLITPYDSIASLAKHKYPFLPIDLLLKYKFQSIKYVKNIDSPISIIEVEDDKTVPNKNTSRLSKKIKNLALKIELKNTTHADVLHYPDFEKILKKAILKF